MTKRRKPKSRRRQSDQSTQVATEPLPQTPSLKIQTPSPEIQRNGFLDTLRGLAIVLMVTDHVAGMLFQHSLQESPIRFATRLSMPLFCVLMGYFLKRSKPIRWRRVGEIVLGCLLVNAIFYTLYGKIEVLGSLLIAYLLFLGLGRFYYLFVFAILFYLDDPSTVLFDYPVTITVSFVAIGVILRQFGVGAAALAAVIITGGSAAIWKYEPGGVNHMLCYFLLPATLLVYAGTLRPSWKIPGLDFIGRYPLTCYVVQYYLLFAIAHLGRL